MPTMDELGGLYKNGVGDRNMTPLLRTTGWYVWSSENVGSSKGRGFNFYDGGRYWGGSDFTNTKRAFAVRSGNESKSKRVEVASLPQKALYSKPSSSTSNVSQRDGIYVAYANGVVKDTNTGLEWKAGPDRDMTWNEARFWVESLNLDGGGWRIADHR